MNILHPARRRAVLSYLLKGCSIRSTVRLTGVSKNTIAKLILESGAHCEGLLDTTLRDLPCQIIEGDEIWTFVQKKQHRVSALEEHIGEVGDQYTFVAFDPASKLIAAHVVGKRDADTTPLFIDQIRRRVPHRFQLFTDGFMHYPTAVEDVYGHLIDFAQVSGRSRRRRQARRATSTSATAAAGRTRRASGRPTSSGTT